jgi:hypothetical protein
MLSDADKVAVGAARHPAYFRGIVLSVSVMLLITILLRLCQLATVV